MNNKEEHKCLTKLEIAKNIAAIGIGKEKPKQETLEEAAENWLYELENTNPIVLEKRYPLVPMKFGFIEGAKSDAARDYWLEQFKKKPI